MDPGFLGVAVTAGALALLTPCVFPLVPITVSYFLQDSKTGHKGGIRNAVVFGSGIVATFTALGLSFAAFVGATGMARFASNPIVNLVIAAVFLAFAFNFLGFYEIRLPSAILNRLDAVSRRGGSSGTLGALFMGMLFALTSFTCTAPFVGTLLVLASQGEWARPIVGMLAFSLTFALPFFLLALAPTWITSLPKSGGWLNSVKVVLGFVEIAAALKFLSNADVVLRWGIFTRPVLLALWAILAGLSAIYLLGRIRFPHDTPVTRITPARSGGALAFVLAGVWLTTGIGGKPLGEIESFMPASLAAEQSAGEGQLYWHLNGLDSALVVAKAEKKNVFIDFTGYTCTNCRWMEANMFTVPEVQAALGKFVLARLFTDGEGEMYEQQQEFQKEKFGTVALPLYAIVDGDGNIVATFPGLTRNRSEFLAFLAKAM